ncbi:PAAR domain-containing protein, partial [Pseudomonas sp. CC120222-01a]|uniref:PAAR domain-containing protein n=1 Tax=Pseudomonas sp. CC120222-01a TaxID=1378075 RepID=UPI000DE749B0
LSHAQRETGWITSGSDNVHINGRPAARAHVDQAVCTDHSGARQTVAQGSRTVYINGQPAARVGDRTICDGRISAGSSNVFIGGDTETTDEIEPEVPGWLEATALGVGIASAIALVGPEMALWGMFGGVIGGEAGYRFGGNRYGDGSDQQKLIAFGSAVVVGGMNARHRIQPNGGLGSNFGNLKIYRRSPASVATGSQDVQQSSALVNYGRNAKYFSKEPMRWSASRQAGTKFNYEVYQRNDINWHQPRTGGDKRFIGKSNLDAATRGLPPQLPDGSFATLHHLGQKAPGPLVEGSTRYHGVGKPGQDILHSQFGRSKPHPWLQPDRKKFDVDSREYWQWRATEIEVSLW